VQETDKENIRNKPEMYINEPLLLLLIQTKQKNALRKLLKNSLD
jgi:hypothetical protein